MDRYKASSIEAFEGPLADRYDNSLVVRMLDLTVMDDFVVDALGKEVADLAILDVGCGTGRLLERLAGVGAKRLAGSDLTSRMIELTRKRLAPPGIELDLQRADTESTLPWPSESFGAVIGTGVLHHFYHPGAALGEMGRVLEKGGRLILADPCFFTPLREILNAALRIRPRAGDYYFYSVRQAVRLLSNHGWMVERCERLNWWAYGIVAQRRRWPRNLRTEGSKGY
jgi:ubiquinone/menaquinone biosynthesis C-methylase UbiE